MGIDEIDSSQFRWQSVAACNDVPSWIFFIEEEFQTDAVSRSAFQNKTYHDFCDTCPVRRKCLEFALVHDMQGIWGGMTEKERNYKFSSGERWEIREYKEDEGQYKALYGHS